MRLLGFLAIKLVLCVQYGRLVPLVFAFDTAIETSHQSPAIPASSPTLLSPSRPPPTATAQSLASLANSSSSPVSLSMNSISMLESRMIVSYTSTTTSLPKPSGSTPQDIGIILERRLSSIIGGITGDAESISSWLSSLGPDGKWPDSEVDYTTGCAARRANWPAQDHWQRILVMAAAWHGGLNGVEQYVKDTTLMRAISLAMDYWFSRDFTNLACLDSGGTPLCPCTNLDNSLWNTNWFSNVILIPDLVGQCCLLMGGSLTNAQVMSCANMSARSYGTFDKNINGLGFLTGANTLDVAGIGIALGLLTNNVSVLDDAYRRIHLELSIKNSVEADGIRADGSFGQHAGVLYNGNYGKDYTNDVLEIEIEAAGTPFAANATSRGALETLFTGDRWMIYRNSITGILHWDFSVLGRFISFPVIDNQATGSINLNLTQVGELGEEWSSTPLLDFESSLSKNSSNTGANAGSLLGNRMFYTNDYMVHRGRSYVSTVKMFSSRTQNTECVNSQNPLGFHLSDGTVYTYVRGDEYEDISAAWDWNLIPGVTTDYGATPLSCNTTQFIGVEPFVGGVSDGEIGLAVMRYTNPFTKSLRWQKTWFFLDADVQHVMIANISSATPGPVYSVLDQRRHSSAVTVDETEVMGSKARTLWHGNVGYVLPFNNTSPLSFQVGQKVGNWSAIGISTQPPSSVDLFSAWLQHTSLSPISYTAFPGVDRAHFVVKTKRYRVQTASNDEHISAIYDEAHDKAMVVFWDSDGGSVSFSPPGMASITVSTTGNLAMIYKLDAGQMVVSDPSQMLLSAQITIKIGPGRKPPHWRLETTKTLVIALPQEGMAGNSVIVNV